MSPEYVWEVGVPMKYVMWYRVIAPSKLIAIQKAERGEAEENGTTAGANGIQIKRIRTATAEEIKDAKVFEK